MKAVEYKNLLYISASNSYNDLCVTKNCIYNLCKNKTNVLWKQVNTISDSINSTIDKTISITKKRLLSYNQVVIDSHPNKWDALLSENKVNTENKFIIGKLSCFSDDLNKCLIDIINNSKVNAIVASDQKAYDLLNNLNITKEILLDTIEYSVYEYQFHSINYFLSIGNLVINKNISNLYINDFDLYYIFDPSIEDLESITDSFLNSLVWEDKKILVIVNADPQSIKEKSKNFPNHAPILIINEKLNLDQIRSLHKIGDYYLQNTNKYLFCYNDFEAINIKNKKIINCDINTNYIEYFKNKNSDEKQEIEHAKEEISDKRILNIGLYGEMFIETTRNNNNGKINLNCNQIAFYSHRSGWDYVMTQMFGYHNENGIMFDGFLENAFAWRKEEYIKNKVIPYKKPWVGVFHNPPNMKPWFTDNASCANMMVNDRYFNESLKSCKGLYVLSEYHARYLREVIKKVPINVLYHPTEIPDIIFSFENFINNEDKKIYNIGWWQRKLNSFYQLKSPYRKVRLLPNNRCSQTIDRLSKIERAIYNIQLTEEQASSVEMKEHIENDLYDIELSKNLVFLDLYDSSANNAIIECIARATPILINMHPAVIEYLGEEYPFYYSCYEEAEYKLNQLDLIEKTHSYLLNSKKRNNIKIETFLQEFERSSIYNSL